MPLLPHAYAASLLKRNDAGQLLFSPDPDGAQTYLVPDAATGEHLLHRLRRIRRAQLAAWAAMPVLFAAFLVATDGIAIPKWAFLSVAAVLVMADTFIPGRARQRLARGLARGPDNEAEPTLLDWLPAWMAVLVVALAVGGAVYIGKIWPVETIAWLDSPEHLRPVLKTFGEITAIAVAAVALFRSVINRLRRWLRPGARGGANRADYSRSH